MNSGSSTLKYQLFNVDGESYEVVARAIAERIGRDASFVGIKYANGDKKEVKVDLPDHKTALNEVMKLLTDGVIGNLNEISAIGHRIVQGGSIFKGSVVVTEKVIEDIESLSTLAPLAQPVGSVGYSCGHEGIAVGAAGCGFRHRVSSDDAGRGLYLRFA